VALIEKEQRDRPGRAREPYQPPPRKATDPPIQPSQ
jgi:hypothetical protein